MPRRDSLRIDGLDDVRKMLQSMEKKAGNKIVRTKIRDGMKRIAAEVKANAPVETGALKASVVVRAAKRKKGFIGVQVRISGGHDSPFVGHVEWGTSRMAAKPFIRPAFRKLAPSVIKEILAAIRSELGLKG